MFVSRKGRGDKEGGWGGRGEEIRKAGGEGGREGREIGVKRQEW